MRIGDMLWTDKLFSGAKSFGLVLSEEEASALTLYSERLLRWNSKLNLTAITRPEEILEKHLLDSLAILPFLPESGSVLDMGTGGGFPGLVIAIMRPDLDVLMVDSVGKKIAFVRDMTRNLGLLRAKAQNLRVEELAVSLAGKSLFECTVSRAFSRLDFFVDQSLSLLAPSGRMLAMKGPEGLKEAEYFFIEGHSFKLSMHSYVLPFGGGKRIILEILRSSLTEGRQPA